MAQLACKNLLVGYEGRTILENLSFEVNSGDYLCIVGENGAGKSTLMKTIVSLHNKMAGSIEFGDNLNKNEIGYLPQQTAIQRDFPASVKEIVLSGFLNHCGLRAFYTRKEKNIAIENMEKMGVKELSKRSYKELSGGQQQRVLLARALCATQKMLLLDEPVSGLDPKATKEMYDLIEKLNKNGITIIMVSHDMAGALKYASHILHIGGKVFFGTKEEYVNADIGGDTNEYFAR